MPLFSNSTCTFGTWIYLQLSDGKMKLHETVDTSWCHQRARWHSFLGWRACGASGFKTGISFHGVEPSQSFLCHLYGVMIICTGTHKKIELARNYILVISMTNTPSSGTRETSTGSWSFILPSLGDGVGLWTLKGQARRKTKIRPSNGHVMLCVWRGVIHFKTAEFSSNPLLSF